MVWKFVIFSFYSILNSVFLDSSLASLFGLPGTCAVDSHSLLLIAQSQIDFVILSQSTDLQTPILFMQWAAVVLSESIFIWESQIWSHNYLSSKKIALISNILMWLRVSAILHWPPVEVFLKQFPITDNCKRGVSNFYSIDWPWNIVFLFTMWIYRDLFVKISVIKFNFLCI